MAKGVRSLFSDTGAMLGRQTGAEQYWEGLAVALDFDPRHGRGRTPFRTQSRRPPGGAGSTGPRVWSAGGEGGDQHAKFRGTGKAAGCARSGGGSVVRHQMASGHVVRFRPSVTLCRCVPTASQNPPGPSFRRASVKAQGTLAILTARLGPFGLAEQRALPDRMRNSDRTGSAPHVQARSNQRTGALIRGP